jgi:hypothetical protein
LIFLAGDIFHDLLDPAIEDPAQVIDGGGIQRSVLAKFIDGGAGYPVVFDQGVGGFTGSAQRIPERSV